MIVLHIMRPQRSHVLLILPGVEWTLHTIGGEGTMLG